MNREAVQVASFSFEGKIKIRIKDAKFEPLLFEGIAPNIEDTARYYLLQNMQRNISSLRPNIDGFYYIHAYMHLQLFILNAGCVSNDARVTFCKNNRV